MEDAFPLVCISGVGYSNSTSAHLGYVQEPGRIAAAFAVATVSPVGGISQWPVSLWVLVKVRGKEEGIFAQIIPVPTRIVEHREAHVEVVRARRRELHLIGDFVRVQPKVGGLSKQRPFLGCRCVGAQNGIAQGIRNRTVPEHFCKSNSGRIIHFGDIVLALQNQVRPRVAASPHHVRGTLHRQLRVGRNLSSHDHNHSRNKARYET